jgi:hypothetical protein
MRPQRKIEAAAPLDQALPPNLQFALGAVGATDTPSSPEHWWRTRPANSFDKSHSAKLRLSLCGLSDSDDPRWAMAVHGDAAAAIGIAVRVFWRGEPTGISCDAAMSSVLACALEGNAAAIVLLSAALQRRSQADESSGSLADSWLVASVSDHFIGRHRQANRAAGMTSDL